MFNGTSIKLQNGVQDQFEKNVLIESFAIHSRNLFDFFYTKGRKDDIAASDYIINKQIFKQTRTKKRILDNLTRKTNKQVAHLTYSRNNYNNINKGWYVMQITNNMNSTILAFLNCLEIKEKEWFKEVYKAFGIYNMP